MLGVVSNLRAELDRRGWSRNRLATELGGFRTRQAIWMLTEPKYEPKEISLELLDRLCGVLGLTPNDIIGRIPETRKGPIPKHLCDRHASRPWSEARVSDGQWCPECKAEKAATRAA